LVRSQDFNRSPPPSWTRTSRRRCCPVDPIFCHHRELEMGDWVDYERLIPWDTLW
jgi:hypothetical protein